MRPVSPASRQALLDALDRLVSGQADRTDGRLTVANLAREAGISRATANRAPDILAELRLAAGDARAPRPTRRRSPQHDADRERRDLENVIAQHAQVRALLQRADERRRRRLSRIGPVEEDG